MSNIVHPFSSIKMFSDYRSLHTITHQEDLGFGETASWRNGRLKKEGT